MRFLRLASSRKTLAHGDRYKNFVSAAKTHGYEVERHYYSTADDYINCAFRIPGPRGTTFEDNKRTKRPILVVQHGLNDSC